MASGKLRTADRADAHVLFHQQANPEENKRKNQKKREHYPSRCRNASFGHGIRVRSTVRAAVILRQVLRPAVNKRLIWGCHTPLRTPRRGRSGSRLYTRLTLGLKLIRLPRIRPRSLIVIVILGSAPGRFQSCTAESAKLTLLGISLAALLALDHIRRDLTGRYHKFI